MSRDREKRPRELPDAAKSAVWPAYGRRNPISARFLREPCCHLRVVWYDCKVSQPRAACKRRVPPPDGGEKVSTGIVEVKAACRVPVTRKTAGNQRYSPTITSTLWLRKPASLRFSPAGVEEATVSRIADSPCLLEMTRNTKQAGLRGTCSERVQTDEIQNSE